MSSQLDWSFWQFVTEAIGFTTAIIAIIIATRRITRTIDKLEERMSVMEKTLDVRNKVLENSPILIAFHELEVTHAKNLVGAFDQTLKSWEEQKSKERV